MSARWRGGCSASSATSTPGSCRRSGRSAPSSSWNTCGRCRRSWRGCTSGSTAAWRSCPRSRRRWRLTGTWTSCWHTWRSSAAPYRSCTWPRARTPRTRPPDPAPATRSPRGSRGTADGGDTGDNTGTLRPSAASSAPPPSLRDTRDGRRRPVAVALAMAGAEAERWRRLVRGVTRLQACVRGHLLRRRFRSLRAQYEAVVREIEGDLEQLEWRGQFLPRPVFVPKPPQEKPSAPQESAPSAAASAEKPQDNPEPERDQGCSSGNPTAQLHSEKEPSSAGEGHAASPKNLGADAKKCTEKSPGESEDRQNDSTVLSAWDSAVLHAGSLGASLEIPLEDVKELPRTRAGLQSYRNHLVMELLWLEQAIASRKNYLMLKKQLGIPDP